MGWGFKMPSVSDIGKRYMDVAGGGGALTGDLVRGGNAETGLNWGGKKGGGGAVGPVPLPKFKRLKPGHFMKAPGQVNAGVKLPDSQVNDAAIKDAMARRFGQQRERTSQEFNAAQDKGMDALQRRFAASGGGASGARLKLEQQLQGETMKQKSDAMREIDTTQELEAAQLDKDAALRADQRSLAQAQLNLSEADLNFRNKVFAFEKGSKMHQLDLAERQQQVDTRIEEYNAGVQQQLARPKKEGFVSRYLGDFL